MRQATKLSLCDPYFIYAAWTRSTSESIYTSIIYNRYNTMLPTFERLTKASLPEVSTQQATPRQTQLGSLITCSQAPNEESTVDTVCCTGKMSLCLSTMSARWTGRKSPRIFNLDTRWRWVETFTFRPLYYPGKGPR